MSISLLAMHRARIYIPAGGYLFGVPEVGAQSIFQNPWFYFEQSGVRHCRHTEHLICKLMDCDKIVAFQVN